MALRASARGLVDNLLHAVWSRPMFPIFLGGPQDHIDKDLTFWFQGTLSGGYQKSWSVGSLRFCGLVGLLLFFWAGGN